MGAERVGNHSGAAQSGPENGSERVSAGQQPVAATLRHLATLIADSPHNLVSTSERPNVLQRHVLEAVAVADELTPAGRWMDLGTGGGLPGLVLAQRHPSVEWTLVDATAKKIAAVTDFADRLGLVNVTAVAARAETLGWDVEHRGAYHGVVARAVAPLPTLVELARGFLGAEGLLVAIKGPAWKDELDAAQPALALLGYGDVHTQRLAAAVRETWLVTMRVKGPPPAGYPRRDGLPKSQPLR